MKYNQELPKEVEESLDGYLERIKKIKFFKPEKLTKSDVDKQINVVIKAFGVEATIEYRKLSTPKDWDAAWDAAWGAAWGAARDAAWGAAWGAARDAAWGAADLLASLTPSKEYKKKYPKGNFLQLVELWEMGLYPVGVVKGKFICYVPNEKNAESLLKEKKS